MAGGRSRETLSAGPRPGKATGRDLQSVPSLDWPRFAPRQSPHVNQGIPAHGEKPFPCVIKGHIQHGLTAIRANSLKNLPCFDIPQTDGSIPGSRCQNITTTRNTKIPHRFSVPFQDLKLSRINRIILGFAVRIGKPQNRPRDKDNGHNGSVADQCHSRYMPGPQSLSSPQLFRRIARTENSDA